MKNKNGQVWIETVLYTLIGLVLIGLVLSYAIPKLQATQEKTIIEQTISSLRVIDQSIQSAVNLGSGNVRLYDLSIKKGLFKVSGTSDSIEFSLRDTTKPYSEVGIPIDFGKVNVVTQEENGEFVTYLILNYSGSFELIPEKGELSLSGSPAPYQIRFAYENVNGTNNLFVTLV